MSDDLELDETRANGMRILRTITAGFGVLPPLGAWLSGNGVAWLAALAGLLALTAWLGTRREDGLARLTLGLALVGQVALVNAALAGHALQMDSHMLFFAAVAMLLLLQDVRVMIAVTGFVAVQHLSLGVLLPGLVFPSADLVFNIARTLGHGAILVLEVGVLVYYILARQGMARALAEQSAKLETALQLAEDRSQLADDRTQAAETAQAAQTQVFETLSHAMQQLARGDLSYRINDALPQTYDGLRRDFNTAVEALCAAMVEVRTQIVRLRDDTLLISEASEGLAQRTESQAAGLSELTSTFHGMTSDMSTFSQEAMDASARASDTSSKAADGRAILTEALQTMERIERGSGEVQKITDMIEDLASQTNLLALNARVEAARAGPAGQGFAVVASEVGMLAQRSAEAAAKIRDLIQSNDAEVKTGVETVGQTEVTIEAVLEAVDLAIGATSTVSAGVASQVAQIQALNNKVDEIDTTTQQNAAVSEETSASTGALLNAIDALGAIVSRFDTAPATDNRTPRRDAA